MFCRSKREYNIYVMYTPYTYNVYNENKDIITRTSLFKYTENFTSKNWKFSDKNLW